MIDYGDFLEDRQPERGSSAIIDDQSSTIDSGGCRVSIQAAGYLTGTPVAVTWGTPGGFFLPPGVFLRASDIGRAAADVRESAASVQVLS